MTREVCLACHKPVPLPGDRYCDNCRCRWCAGDATGPEAIEVKGHHYCNDACKGHHIKYLKQMQSEPA